MALTGDAFAFHFSVESGYLDPQTDPDQSLGGFRSATRVEELESAVTSVVSTFMFIDTAQIGGGLDHVGKWMVFVTGNNAVGARQILFHDNTTGEIGVAPEWGSTPQVGDDYRISEATGLFDDVSAPECAEGHVDHRCLYLLNSTSVTLTDIRFYLEPLDHSGTNMEVTAGNRSVGTDEVPVSADEEDDPDTDSTGAGGFTTTTPQRFRSSRDYASAIEVPSTTSGWNLTNGSTSALWIRRTIPSLSKRFDDAAWLLVAEETGGVKTAVPIVFNLDGYTAQVTAAFDRTPRTFGGAHITVEVIDADFEFPIEDEDVFIAIDSGPGTLNSAAQPIDTDEDGIARAVYVSPEDDAQAGNTVVIEAKVGGDT
jgi:hypothetical protein